MPSSHELAPRPGVYAVPAALAAELVAKAARQTAAVEDPFGALAEDMEQIAVEGDELRLELLAVIDADERAFARVLEARRAGGCDEIRAAYRAAVEPPLRARELARRVLELAVEVAERGNPQTAAETGMAALFATASAESAALSADLELAIRL